MLSKGPASFFLLVDTQFPSILCWKAGSISFHSTLRLVSLRTGVTVCKLPQSSFTSGVPSPKYCGRLCVDRHYKQQCILIHQKLEPWKHFPCVRIRSTRYRVLFLLFAFTLLTQTFRLHGSNPDEGNEGVHNHLPRHVRPGSWRLRPDTLPPVLCGRLLAYCSHPQALLTLCSHPLEGWPHLDWRALGYYSWFKQPKSLAFASCFKLCHRVILSSVSFK